MITSKLTTRRFRSRCAALHLRDGDELVYEIEGQRVILTKARQDQQGDDPFHTFSEWND